MSLEVTVEGENDLIRLMQTLPPEIFDQVHQVLQNSAVRLAELAREKAPIRTGHLKASIHPDLGEDVEAESAFRPVMVVAEAEYATFVEFGTSKMEPRPFLGPAVEELQPQILEEVDRILEELGLESKGGLE